MTPAFAQKPAAKPRRLLGICNNLGLVPEYFFRTAGSAKSFGEGAKSSATVPKSTWEFDVPGWDVRTADYDVALSLHKALLSDKIHIRSIAKGYTNPSSVIPANQSSPSASGGAMDTSAAARRTRLGSSAAHSSAL